MIRLIADMEQETGLLSEQWQDEEERRYIARGTLTFSQQSVYKSQDVVQVNIPAESGEMGVLANHVPSIEQLKPGLIEVIEESGGSKQFFRTWPSI